MAKYNFLSHEWFSDRLLILTEGYSMVHRFTIGVVVGDEKVLVIDAGLGMHQDLRKTIEELVGTEKPIICACTHGHLDHVGSACQFDEAYCSHLDVGTTRMDPFDPINRYCDCVDFALESKIVADYCKKNMIVDNRVEFKDIKDGDVFDLGGVKIEAIAVPGHSLGSMAFFNREEKYVFTGDAVNTDTHLKHLDTAGFREYVKVLDHFISIVGDDVTIYPAHLPLEMTIDVAKNLRTACAEIAAGNIDHDPPCDGIFHARKQNRNIRGHYVGNVCAVYDRSLQDAAKDKRLNVMDSCYYSHEKWTDRIYTVTINYSTVNRITLMVFIGDNKILCIDSGHGIDDKLVDYIRGFAGSGKPVIEACTHVGIDHAGGSILFDEVYMHPNDIKKVAACDKARRFVDVQPFSNYATEFQEYTYANMLETIDDSRIKPIYDGDVFDLGGIRVECIFTPGHSTGHMAFYCKEAGICMSGDAMNVDTHLKGMDREGFKAYVKMLDNFFTRVSEDTMIFSSHLNRPHRMRVPRNIREACREIAEGKTEGDQPGEAIQQHTNGFHNPAVKMHYHGNCCVVYNESLLDRKA